MLCCNSWVLTQLGNKGVGPLGCPRLLNQPTEPGDEPSAHCSFFLAELKSLFGRNDKKIILATWLGNDLNDILMCQFMILVPSGAFKFPRYVLKCISFIVDTLWTLYKGFLKKEHFSVWKEYCQTFWTSISDHWRSRGVQKKLTPFPFSLTLSAVLPIFLLTPGVLLRSPACLLAYFFDLSVWKRREISCCAGYNTAILSWCCIKKRIFKQNLNLMREMLWN